MECRSSVQINDNKPCSDKTDETAKELFPEVLESESESGSGFRNTAPRAISGSSIRTNIFHRIFTFKLNKKKKK